MRVELNDSSLANESLLDLLKIKENGLPKKVVLVFPQTSAEWRKKNYYPRKVSLWEFSIPRLIEDVVLLVSKGVFVSIETPMNVD